MWSIFLGYLAFALLQTATATFADSPIACNDGKTFYVCRTNLLTHESETQCSHRTGTAVQRRPGVTDGPCPINGHSMMEMPGSFSTKQALLAYQFPAHFHQKVFGSPSAFSHPVYKFTTAPLLDNESTLRSTYKVQAEQSTEETYTLQVENVLYEANELLDDMRSSLSNEDLRFMYQSQYGAEFVVGTLDGQRAIFGIFSTRVGTNENDELLTFAVPISNGDFYLDGGVYDDEHSPAQEYYQACEDLDEHSRATLELAYAKAQLIHGAQRMALGKEIWQTIAIGMIQSIRRTTTSTRFGWTLFQNEFRAMVSAWMTNIRQVYVGAEVESWHAINASRDSHLAEARRAHCETSDALHANAKAEAMASSPDSQDMLVASIGRNTTTQLFDSIFQNRVLNGGWFSKGKMDRRR